MSLDGCRAQLAWLFFLVLVVSCMASQLRESGILVFGHDNDHCTACMGPRNATVEPQWAKELPEEVEELGVWWPTVFRLSNGTMLGCGIHIPTSGNIVSCPIYPLQIGSHDFITLHPNETVSHFSVGGYHASFLTRNGHVFTIGKYDAPPFGLENIPFDTGPNGREMTSDITLQEDEKILSVSSGPFNSAALTSFGYVWIWGGFKVGECGQGYNSSNNTNAKLVEWKNAGESHFIRSVALGNGATTLVTDSQLLSAGDKEQLGRPSDGDGLWFERVANSQHLAYPLHSIVSGGKCFMALDAHRKVWIFGSGPQTALVTGAQTSAKKLPDFDASVEDIALTYHMAFVLTSSGTLYSWGILEYHQPPLVQTLPAPIPSFQDSSLYNASTSIISKLFHPTGGSMMFVVVKPICDTCITEFGGPIIVSSPVTLIGNLTASQSNPITINAGSGEFGTLLNITGCLDVDDGIIDLNLDPSLLSTKGTKSIALLETSCVTGGVPRIQSNLKPNRSCERTKIRTKLETGPSARSTLVALISVDSNRCRIWWIVVVSVVGGLIIMGAVAAVIMRIVLSRREKEKYGM